MRLIDGDALNSIKFHPLPYTHITPSDADAESYKRGWNDAIDSIIENAPTIKPEQHWIPCSERLPELDVYVIATTQWYEITMACRIGDGEWFIHEDNANAYDDDILAWMPLPEPYRP